MTGAFAAAIAIASIAIFATIASERARAYGVAFSATHVSAVISAVAAVSVSLWLGMHEARAIAKAVALACAALSAATDLQTGYIFDRVVVAGLLALFALAIQAHAFLGSAAGCVVGGGLPLLVYAATGGRGIGLGDVKLAATIGAGLEVAGAVEALRVAVICAGSAAAALWLCGRVQRRSAMRFAPFLAIGASYGALACS